MQQQLQQQQRRPTQTSRSLSQPASPCSCQLMGCPRTGGHSTSSSRRGTCATRAPSCLMVRSRWPRSTPHHRSSQTPTPSHTVPVGVPLPPSSAHWDACGRTLPLHRQRRRHRDTRPGRPDRWAGTRGEGMASVQPHRCQQREACSGKGDVLCLAHVCCRACTHHTVSIAVITPSRQTSCNAARLLQARRWWWTSQLAQTSQVRSPTACSRAYFAVVTLCSNLCVESSCQQQQCCAVLLCRTGDALRKLQLPADTERVLFKTDNTAK